MTYPFFTKYWPRGLELKSGTQRTYDYLAKVAGRYWARSNDRCLTGATLSNRHISGIGKWGIKEGGPFEEGRPTTLEWHMKGCR